ncbi:unnamed protein product [Ambrosiozyma monospora]|uniref:Unnamed protein product n=1 Tax=Ambrosiozyma monospora TaxID=43982 RepID=A0A9W6YTP8_AMBMO|nr:unnamed protein product [Ambrosiozyma monospora]
MAFSKPNLIETGIKLASCLLPEIQCIILKFVIKNFLFFIDDIDNIKTIYLINSDTGDFYDHTTIECSGNIQAQLLSLTGYDDLLDDIVLMALEELDLEFWLGGFDDPPFIDEFIDFVTSRSVQLKHVVLMVYTCERLTKPNTMKLLEFHSDQVTLGGCNMSYGLPKNFLPLKFVTFLHWDAAYLPRLLDPALNSFTSLFKLSITLPKVESLSKVEGIMEHLQLAVPSMKHLYLDFEGKLDFEEWCVDFLVQANTFIRKHKNLYIHFEIRFLMIRIESYWIFDSRTQLSLPLHTPYPRNTKEIDRVEQWCSVSGLISFKAYTHEVPMPFITDTEIPFIRAINSPVSIVHLNCFTATYEIVLDGFSSLKELLIKFSILNKFPRLPESLRELEILYVDDQTSSDVDHGIILPTRLCSLVWHSNLACFALPKILNIDKLLYLKDVTVEICPFEYTAGVYYDEYDVALYGEDDNVDDYITWHFLQVTNACTTIDQLQQFVSQLPSDLEILTISIYGFILPQLDDYFYACCPDKLSFKRFTNLKYLECNCFSNDNLFNVSLFPAVEHLSFISHPVLTGCFAQGIRSLEVNLETYGESVSYFLSHFISKLTSLVDISIEIDQSTTADIREVALSSQLCSLTITFSRNDFWENGYEVPPPYGDLYGCVILSTFPVQLNYVQLLFTRSKIHDIIVDDYKGESISSMQKRVCVSRGRAKWVQYSHFDCDEESFGIESLYAN